MPTAEEMRRFYDGGHHPHAAQEGLELRREQSTVLVRVRELSPRGQTLLDVGCGFGHYLRASQRYGFSCVGIELDPERARIARQTGAEVYEGAFSPDMLGERLFDVILLNHVIEHMSQPTILLSELATCLAPRGVLFVATPNFSGLVARIMGRHFVHYTPPEHVVYFTARGLTAALDASGWSVRVRDGYSHPEGFKTLVAHLLRLRWARPPRYLVAERDAFRRFVSGRMILTKRAIYELVLALGRAALPTVQKLGPDHLHYYANLTEIPARGA